MLSALGTRITPNVVLKGQAIGNALYGLQNLKNSEAVEAVLSALAKHITPNVVLNGQNVGNALYGLQNLKNSEAVEAVLSALGTRITPNVVLNGQEIGNAIFGLSCLDETPSSTTLLEQILTNLSAAVGNQKFSAQSIVYKSFSKWLQPLGHLETKLNFLKTMLQPDQSWTEVARCLNLSDYRKLRSSIQTTQDNQFPLASMLLKVIRESNDPKLLQLRQLTDPQQHSEELLARNAPPPSQQQALLLYAAIEATQDQMGSQLNIGLVRKINCLHKLLPPALTVAGLNPRCESLLPPQNIRLGTTGNKSQRPDLVILLPTRGHKPDVPPMQFLRSLDQSLTEARKLNAETSVLVVLGINGQDEGQAAKDAIVLRSEGVATSIKADRGFKNNIQVKLLTFSWATDQNPGAKRIIPFGTIRNHCFDQAIVGMPDSARFVSMDGDTTLTAPALERIMALGANEATTLAYRLDKQSQKENSATSAALDLHWKIQAKTNMTLNGRTNSLAYPAEPCLAVGSAGLQRLKTLHIDQQKVFGSTDCEGRFLMRNLLAGDVRFVPVNEANAVEFHNFARFQVKQYPLTNRDQLIKQLSAYAGQSQNMSNLDFFTRQLAFGLSRPDAFIRPVTKPLYVPNLLKSGLSLKKIQDVLSSLPELKSLNKAHAFAADAIGNLSKEVFEGYQRCIQYCGIDYANTIFDNALEWAKTVTGEAIGLSLKTPRHTRTELLNGNIPNTRVAAQLKGPEPGTSAWGASGFAAAGLGVVRQNKDPRDVYPQLPKPLERLGSKRAAFLSLNQPIPKKRRVDESATAALPTREQKNLKPDFRTIYNTAFSKLSGQMRDLYSLLNAEHFGEQRLMSESEIREQFYCQVLDVIGDETVSETQMKQYIRESLFNILRGSVVSA